MNLLTSAYEKNGIDIACFAKSIELYAIGVFSTLR